MTIEELVEKVKHLQFPQSLDPDYEGSCPCFTYRPEVNGVTIEIHGHCWRTCPDCAYNGLHITGALPKSSLTRIGQAFKKQLDKQKWYSPYSLVIKSTLIIQPNHDN